MIHLKFEKWNVIKQKGKKLVPVLIVAAVESENVVNVLNII